jgi:hypothetical protein
LLAGVNGFHKYSSDILIEGSEDKTEPDGIRGVRDVVKAIGDIYQSPSSEDLVNSYVCIKNPQFLLEGQTLSFDGHFWMGKMDSVDGFIHAYRDSCAASSSHSLISSVFINITGGN